MKNKHSAGRVPDLWLRACLAAGLAAAVLPAQAQRTTYRCVQNNVVVLSDRPCEGTVPTRIGAVGSAPQYPAAMRSAPVPMQPRSAEHVRHLSAACAELNDAVRTAPSRGLKWTLVRELENEYQQRCADEDSAARQQVRRDVGERRQANEAQRKAEAASAAQLAQERDRCAEMQRILQAKRQKAAGAGPGEQADLQRFADNYNARCLGR